VADGALAITMYTTATCPFCVRAERYLIAKGVSAIDKIRVDLDPTLRLAMMERTGRRTVPQIYVGDVHIGGYEDLVALDRAGGLAPLLGVSTPAAG
jgi:glutaredoxin 3